MPAPNLDPAHTLYLVDISSFIFRAFFAIRPLTTKKGEPVNAVYGVATMLAKLAEQGRPRFMAIAYDSKEPSFREEMYSDYKANRSEPPEDLIPQFARIEQLVDAFEIHSYRQAGVEADDLIATLARKWKEASPENQVVVVSGDKDLMQLVDQRVVLWDTMADKVYGSPEVEEKMGVKPAQVRDYLGLVGDSVDNIPGVPGVGPKTAADLLKEHGSLEAVLGAAKAGKISGKRGIALVEHEKAARLSAELATVREDLDLEVNRKDLEYRFHMNEDCKNLLDELNFQSLIAKWGKENSGVVRVETGASSGSHAPDSNAFRMVDSEESFVKLLNALENSPEFGFDVETTSLNPREAVLVGIALSYDPSHGYYIPLAHRVAPFTQLSTERVLQGLRPLLENPRYKKVGQNLKYDINVMAEHGIELNGIGADTMVASYVLEPEGRHNLETLSQKYLEYTVMTYEQVCGKGGKNSEQLVFDQVAVDVATRYSAEDAMVALRLWHRLRDELQSERLMDVLSIVDLPMVQVLARMEREGVCIDVPWLTQLSHELGHELRAIEGRIHAYAKGEVNLNSPKQLAKLLFEELGLPPQGKNKTGLSTDASVLEALAPLHEVPRLLLEYREISKLKGTYVDPLPELRDKKSGKIHASFHQTVAATGRLSSSEPNLQNIPIRSERGRKIRRAFIPSPGNVLLAADYSQIELRLLAHMSGDPELVGAFQRDEDVHRRTASELFGVSPESVDERQRSIAKAINFGLMYGKTPFGLAQELKIPRKEAQNIIDRYFTRYRAVKDFLDRQVSDAKEKGYVETLMGRRRKLPDIRSANAAMRGFAERMAMNTPIQGTAADLMKLAMIQLDEKLRSGGFRSRLIIQVHDEVVLDCPKEEAPDVQRLVCEVMESAGAAGALDSRMRLSVPLRVNSGVGDNWMDL